MRAPDEELLVGHRYLVDLTGFRLTGLDYGDVVTFPIEVDGGGHLEIAKRVVGLPGDTTSCVDGRVHRNGRAVEEAYLAPGSVTECSSATVQSDQVYVLGDNRQVSHDSRHFGSIAESSIDGRVLVR